MAFIIIKSYNFCHRKCRRTHFEQTFSCECYARAACLIEIWTNDYISFSDKWRGIGVDQVAKSKTELIKAEAAQHAQLGSRQTQKRNLFEVKNESQWGTSKISDTKQHCSYPLWVLDFIYLRWIFLQLVLQLLFLSKQFSVIKTNFFCVILSTSCIRNELNWFTLM